MRVHKRIAFLVLLLTFSLLVTGVGKKENLVVYTYDSFVSWGPAKFMEKTFQERYHIPVEFVATGDSRQMLAQLIAEAQAGKTDADVFIGIERSDLPKIEGKDLFEPLSKEEVPLLSQVSKDIRFDPQNRLLPYEYGYITLVYDRKVLKDEEVPHTFQELTDPTYKDMLIVEDPRTSSPGYSLLLWTIYQYGEDYLDYWKRLKPNILTVTKGWSEAYTGLFLSGEAPMVVSFSTDTAYSVMEKDTARYGVLLLNNQGYLNIYGMGVVKGTDNPKLAKKFINFILSTEVQEKIPTTEWMFPANPNALLPVNFYQYAVKPPVAAALDLELIAENSDRWLKEWAQLMRK